MKLRACLLALPLVLAAAWVIAQEALPPAGPAGAPAADPPVDARHYSYLIGNQIGESFHNDEIELDVDSLLAGLKDGLSGADARYSEEILGAAMRHMYKLQEQSLQKRNAKFLTENAKAAGVVTLPSGLQYKVISEGNGPSPKATDTVQAKYRGTFIDGQMFDESGDEAVSFPLNRVIKGWTEALQLMKVGSKWQLFVPSTLGYGPDGRDGIPPHSTLIFEVELVGIE
jgi:FKBP-type peptidyl-prolyl cis-trans isomerase FklB